MQEHVVLRTAPISLSYYKMKEPNEMSEAMSAGRVVRLLGEPVTHTAHQ